MRLRGIALGGGAQSHSRGGGGEGGLHALWNGAEVGDVQSAERSQSPKPKSKPPAAVRKFIRLKINKNHDFRSPCNIIIFADQMIPQGIYRF